MRRIQDIHHPGGKLGRKTQEGVYRATPNKNRNRMRRLNESYTKNSYNFKNFAWSEISILLDGNTQPIRLLKPNYAGRQYIQAFMSLFFGTGKENRDEGNDITHKDYHKGYALYAFDLSPHLAEKGHFNLAKQGTVRWNSNLERLYRTL